jgi:hypothetical protein
LTAKSSTVGPLGDYRVDRTACRHAAARPGVYELIASRAGRTSARAGALSLDEPWTDRGYAAEG